MGRGLGPDSPPAVRLLSSFCLSPCSPLALFLQDPVLESSWGGGVRRCRLPHGRSQCALGFRHPRWLLLAWLVVVPRLGTVATAGWGCQLIAGRCCCVRLAGSPPRSRFSRRLIPGLRPGLRDRNQTARFVLMLRSHLGRIGAGTFMASGIGPGLSRGHGQLTGGRLVDWAGRSSPSQGALSATSPWLAQALQPWMAIGAFCLCLHC